MAAFSVARLDEIAEIDNGQCPFRPVRLQFGIMTFGVNAMTARSDGDRLVNEPRGDRASPLAGGFLSGKYRSGAPVDLTSGRAALQPERFDPEIPENAAKLALTDQLAELARELGTTLPCLALAFPLTHPVVSSVIIGPRTLDQVQRILAGAELALDDPTLDRIDQIVPPGVDHYRTKWRPAHLDQPHARRRPDTDRAAAIASRDVRR